MSKTKAPAGRAANPLGDAMAPFVRGDYAQARAALLAERGDPNLSQGEREEVEQRIAATRSDRGALWTGAAALGLLLIVAIWTALTQP